MTNDTNDYYSTRCDVGNHRLIESPDTEHPGQVCTDCGFDVPNDSVADNEAYEMCALDCNYHALPDHTTCEMHLAHCECGEPPCNAQAAYTEASEKCAYCANTTLQLGREDDYATLCLRGNACRRENRLTLYSENQRRLIHEALQVRYDMTWDFEPDFDPDRSDRFPCCGVLTWGDHAQNVAFGRCSLEALAAALSEVTL